MAERQFAAAPDNEYLLISQRGVKETLERLEHEDAAARPLPVPRRVRLRGEPERAPRPAVARAASTPPRSWTATGRRRRCSTSAAGCRPSTAWRSAATTSSARSTPRPSSRRRTGAGGRGTWPSTCSRPPARRCTRRSTASWSGARTGEPPGDYGGLLVLRHEGPFWTLHGHLDPETLATGAVRAGRGDRAARRARGQRRLGAAHASPAVHGPGRRPRRRRAPGGGRPVPQRLPRSRTCCSACPGGVDARAARPDIAERRRTVMSRALSLAYQRAAAHRPRARRVPLRRRRPAVPRPRQQRRARRPLPSARGRGRRAADGGAEHEHALPAPAR